MDSLWIRDTCVCFLTRKAARAVTRLYDDALRSTGLRATQFTILVVIHAKAETTLTALADELVMERTTLARDIRPLEAAGWIHIATGEDRRTRVITLTPAGYEQIVQALPLWEQAQRQIMLHETNEAEWIPLRDNLQTLTARAIAAKPLPV